MRELFARNMTLGHESMFEILEEQASCHDIVIECAKQLKVVELEFTVEVSLNLLSSLVLSCPSVFFYSVK